MDRKKLVLLVAALIIALGTSLVAWSMFSGAGAPRAASAASARPLGPTVLRAHRAPPVAPLARDHPPSVAPGPS